MLKLGWIPLWSLLMLTGCASSSVSLNQVPSHSRHAVNKIAISTLSDPVGEAVGSDLIRRGMMVVRSWELKDIMQRLRIQDKDLDHAESLALLKAEGIDAVLSAKVVGGRIDNPNSITTLVRSTHSGQYLADIEWSNAFAGMPGSPADMLMRKRLGDGVRETGEGVLKELRRK
ncbi:MAG: hypothetical protein QM776_11030 [Rhodocyclaceae bacterium]